MKKYYLWLLPLGLIGYLIYTKYFQKPKSNIVGTGPGSATNVPTPYNAKAKQNKLNNATANNVNDYLGAAGTLFTGIRGFFGNNSASTGQAAPSTSGSGSASPNVVTSGSADSPSSHEEVFSDADTYSEGYTGSGFGDLTETSPDFGG